jgi:hypothetical protein
MLVNSIQYSFREISNGGLGSTIIWRGESDDWRYTLEGMNVGVTVTGRDDFERGCDRSLYSSLQTGLPCVPYVDRHSAYRSFILHCLAGYLA